jgi:hypothetical protein
MLMITRPKSILYTNRYPNIIYMETWDIIKDNLLKWEKTRIEGHGRSHKLNFLALSPEDIIPNSYKRFRTISLCNTFYKIVMKII